MKTIITLSLCFISYLSFSQDDVYSVQNKGPFTKVVDSLPFKNASKMLVKNGLTKTENYNLVKQILSKMEIELDSEKEQSGQIKSGLIPIEGSSGNYIITMFCRENEISMSSMFKSGISSGGFIRVEDGYQPVKYFNVKRGNIMFNKMKEIGDQLKGKIYYTN